ncbi:MAG: L-aspartate oxidase [Candidatus Lindowbacteria bacterium]|nr:L-aspartate oxidase [Candidatus Lindowbacteria bacterium]
MTPAYVVGSGIAGLRFSLFLAEHRPVVIITKKAAVESNTNYAQGGIAAAFGSDDSVDLHLQDTLNTGCGLTDPDIARIVVTEGPELIRELMDMGANFARDKKGELDLGREGGHSRNRVVHSADATGRVVERVLLNAAEAHPNITVQPFHLAIDLIVEDNAVGGLVIMTDTGEIKKVPAALVCLTTGGVGRVFHYTTNPEIATGDGIAMGFRAGAKIRDMEFVQFHPTALARSGTGAFLISEAVRGEGGKLRLINGDPFMEHYDPERLELAPRDIVPRAIDTELKRTGDPHVLLDVTHLDSNFVKKRFPTIYSTCLVHGIEIDKEPIPVVPAAHYSCGGIVTDDRARSSVQGLYAVGETASHGLHGANRLASNSLLEALVFSRRGAETAAGEADRAPLFAPEILDYSSRPTCGLAGLYIHQLTSAMSEFVGIFRRKDSLRKAQLQVSAILKERSV